jgi:LysM repeat protein
MKPITDATLGVRTADGSIVPLLDSRLTTGSRVVFTTTADGQRRAVFDFYYQAPGRTDWTYIDSLSLPNIPQARAGVPDLELRSALDPRGDLRLELRDPVSGRLAAFVLEARHLKQLLVGSFKAPTAGRQPMTAAGPQQAPAKKRWGIRLLALAACAVLAAGGLLLAINARGRRISAKDSTPQPPAIQVASESPPAPSRPADPPAPKADPMRKVASANYRINWGDTLWRIAERYYGERGLYRELAENNVLNDPDLIIAGKSLQLPSTLAGRRRKIGGQ